MSRRSPNSRVAAEIGRDCLAVRVRLLNRAVTRVYDSALRPHGVTVAQLNVLSSIANLQPVTAASVAELLSMEISTLSRNARLLQQEGWIEVARAARGNGRVLSLTAAGERKLSGLRPAWRRAQTEAAELMGPETTRAIKRLVDGHLVAQLARINPDDHATATPPQAHHTTGA
jgi:DNA-binding MarR family transcriptional regulator